MRILLVGAHGTLGRAVAAELSARHQVIRAGRTDSDLRLDLTDPDSVQRALDSAGPLDAIVSGAGNVHFGPLTEMTDALYGIGLRDRLVCQVNLVLAGRAVLADGGSFTPVSGVLADEPIRNGSSASMVNGALEALVRAAAVELPRGLRIDAVSPGVLQESMPGYAPYCRGFEPVPGARAALAFSRSVEGADTGKIYRLH
jgi:NAD(P)-dependent dehydrogenase (short-subunit alcohol dehydrogenase family)